MKILCYWWVAMLPLAASAQNQLKIQPGTRFTVAGNTAITLQNMSLHNDGIIEAGTGSFVFTGNHDNAISGASTTLFNTLQMAKTGTLSLQQHIRIGSGITFGSGHIDLNGYSILLEPTALLNNESETSRIMGSAGGYVQIVATLNAPMNANPGNLGAGISSTQNLGITTIRRGHVLQTDAYNNGSSILRYYDILPANNTNLNAVLTVNYLDAELNGLSEPLLSMWRSTDNRVWKNLGSSSFNTTTNALQQSSLNSFGRFTLTTFNNALPLTFLSFNVSCNDNEVSLQWKTAQEVNTSHFVIERSQDGLNYTSIAQVPAAGNAPQASYLYPDRSPAYAQAFYRIVAYDVDGSKYYTGINTSRCNDAEGFKLAPNPAQNKAWVTINTPVASTVYISLFNNKGQLVHSLRNQLSAGSNQLPLNVGALPAGSYHGIATWHNGARRQSFTLLKGVN